MNLKIDAEKVERRLRHKLENYFKDHYNEERLPSHGLDHHRRVWEFAKEILKYNKEDIHNIEFLEKLLIASYLHDIGMSEDYGVKHGYLSRKLAEDFILTNNLKVSDYNDVLYSIEYHDNKEYNKGIHHNEILKILSVADDLDAFGETGISRYMEIYLARGIPKERLGYAVLENAEARFANFELFAGRRSLLYEKHKKRYLILKSYFENYNNNLQN